MGASVSRVAAFVTCPHGEPHPPWAHHCDGCVCPGLEVSRDDE